MKKVFTALCGLFLAAISFAAGNGPLPKAETATIYIYRTGQFAGAANNWAMFVDGQKICKLSNKRYIKVEVPAGKHRITSKIGGVEILKKETEVEIEAEAGQTYYVACNMKQSITRARLEMLEVTKSTGEKQLQGMTLDNCQNTEEDKEAKK